MASEKVALRKLELDHELKLKRLDVLSKALDALTPTVTAIGLAIFGIYLPSKVLAGHITFASIGINVLGDLSIWDRRNRLWNTCATIARERYGAAR
jgi:hypothetical protein